VSLSSSAAHADGPALSSKSNVEAPLQLDLSAPPPQPLGLLDQTVLWLSMGVSLLIPAAAVFVLYPVPDGPPMTVVAAIAVIILGVVAGSGLLGLAAAAGARTGAPAMAMLRGLLGSRVSYLPSVLNLLQCFGWAALEIFVIGTVATAVTSSGLRIMWMIIAGVIATLMAIRPLGMVKVIRRYLGWLVLVATVLLLIGLISEGVSAPPQGDWSGFWPAFDVVVALPVSWVPLAADFTRHSRTPRSAGIAAFGGYAVAASTFFVLGLLAVLAVSSLSSAYTATTFSIGLLALPLGGLALTILLVDEVDKAFANIYSTAMSTQNLMPKVDRRWLAAGIGVVATAAALLINLESYESFLYLIGAVFVPLAVVLVLDFFLVRKLVFGQVGAGYDVVNPGPARYLLLLPWAAGFVAYQLISPGLLDWWSTWWLSVRSDLGFVPPTWLSATVAGALVAAVLTLLISTLLALSARRTAARTTP
jgi:NCS1 family nucleobase:cation symporter-1